MPMMTKDWMGLPVAPFHSPERTRSEKALMRPSTSCTSGTTFLPPACARIAPQPALTQPFAGVLWWAAHHDGLVGAGAQGGVEDGALLRGVHDLAGLDRRHFLAGGARAVSARRALREGELRSPWPPPAPRRAWRAGPWSPS